MAADIAASRNRRINRGDRTFTRSIQHLVENLAPPPFVVRTSLLSFFIEKEGLNSLLQRYPYLIAALNAV
jgi:hypothetical protein